MSNGDDDKLDALLRRAAPGEMPADFAEGIVAEVHRRRRGWRFRRVGFASALAAAAVLVAMGLWWRAGTTADREAPPLPSFAVSLPSTGIAEKQVMMGRVDGRIVLVVRPAAHWAEEANHPRAAAWMIKDGEPAPGGSIAFVVH